MAYNNSILLLCLLVLVMSSHVLGRGLAEESVQAANVKENGYGHGGYGGGGYGHGGYGGGGYGHGGHGGGGYGHGGHGGGGGGYGHGGHGGGYGGGRGGHPHKQGSTETEN